MHKYFYIYIFIFIYCSNYIVFSSIIVTFSFPLTLWNEGYFIQLGFIYDHFNTCLSQCGSLLTYILLVLIAYEVVCLLKVIYKSFLIVCIINLNVLWRWPQIVNTNSMIPNYLNNKCDIQSNWFNYIIRMIFILKIKFTNIYNIICLFMK